ncbi:MAG TPA: DUF177 domain-containing protein [Rhizomicrobium sp.]|jgi:uncharacterized metal-binding protein YceD (DUF177 family)
MNPPLQKIYDLSSISAAGAEVTITAKPEELPALAQWFDIDAMEAFEAKLELRKLSQTRFHLDATMNADVVQACVVTLGPVKTHIERRFSRTLHLTTGPAVGRETIIVTPADDESPEEIASTRYDLVEPLLEELALSIDPYPRAAGAEFSPPGDGKSPEESPFAVLKRLKRGS